MMPFMGVRISCDMVERKSDLAAEAFCACLRSSTRRMPLHSVAQCAMALQVRPERAEADLEQQHDDVCSDGHVAGGTGPNRP